METSTQNKKSDRLKGFAAGMKQRFTTPSDADSTTTSTNPEKTLSVATEELWIDKHHFAPMKFVEYDRYGNVIRQVEYKNLTIDVGLNQELFTTFDADNHKQPQDRYVK